MNLNFVCVGGTKCGTTWLSEMLRSHPEINVSLNKEPCYFSNNYQKGTKWYKNNWSKKAGKKGEFSAHYLYNKLAINRLKNDYPNVKIIVLLREPLSRSISHYRMVSRGKFIADDANLEDFDVDIFERSCYFRHIAFLFKIFPREQVLIEYYDTILDNPEKLLEKIYGFLEIKSNNFPDNINRWYGKGFNPKYIFLDRIRQVSHDYLQKKQMYKLIIWIKKMRLPNFYKWLVPKRKGVNKNHINLLKSQKQRLYSDLINLNSADIDFDKHAIKKWLSVDSNKV